MTRSPGLYFLTTLFCATMAGCAKQYVDIRVSHQDGSPAVGVPLPQALQRLPIFFAQVAGLQPRTGMGSHGCR